MARFRQEKGWHDWILWNARSRNIAVTCVLVLFVAGGVVGFVLGANL